MLIFKYERTGNAAYLPHLDVLRLFSRTVRRAGLSVRYSGGFHPHMLLWFGNPMSLGIASLAEYAAADSDEEPEVFLRRFNEKSVEGVRLRKCRRVDRNPNFADILDASEYEISGPDLSDRFDEIKKTALAPDFSVVYPNGTTKSVAGKILGIRQTNGRAVLLLRTGRENLKPDALMRAVFAALGIAPEFTVLRTRQFVQTDVDADTLF